MVIKLESRAQFDGQPGGNPGRGEYRYGDPFGRQLAVASDANRLYVSNRFQVNAYALPGGQQVWAQSLGAEQGEAHAFPFCPMKPLIAGDRLYVRRLTKAGIELACLQSDNGNVLWKQRPNAHVLTDPVFWNGSLFAVTVSRIDDEQLQIEATRFDYETGAATSSQPMFRLKDLRDVKDIHDRTLVAQMTLFGRVAVCSIAGTTVCFDSAGNVLWLRRHVWLPKTIDDLAEDYRTFPPFIVPSGRTEANTSDDESESENRVIVSLPGVRSIYCLDLKSGRRIWEHPLPDLRGIITVSGERILADTKSGLVALSRDDGSITWTRKFDARLEALHADGNTVVVAHRATITGNKSKPFLVWLDLSSGTEVAQSQLAGVEREESQFGPFVFAAGKWFAFAGQGWKDPKRELNELVPAVISATGQPHKPGPFGTAALGPWLPDITETQQADLALTLPGWFPAATYPVTYKLELSDVRGESSVLSTKLVDTLNFVLIGDFDIPSGKKSTLRLRVGNQPDRKYQLTIRVENRVVMEKVIEDASGTNGWQDLAVDLTPFAGRHVPITLTHNAFKQQQTEVLWKRASIETE